MTRPEWVPTQEILEKAEYYGSIGLTKEQIASCLGIGVSTLYYKIIDYPEFAEAIKRGLNKGIAKVADLLVKQAESGNTSATIFWLKARANWSDHNVDDIQRIVKNEVDEVRKMVQECMQTKN